MNIAFCEQRSIVIDDTTLHGPEGIAALHRPLDDYDKPVKMYIVEPSSDHFLADRAMDQIIVDNSFTRQMPAAHEPCLVFDSTGKRLGCFTPDADSTLYQNMKPSVSADELDRRERAGGGRTLPEILGDLGQVK